MENLAKNGEKSAKNAQFFEKNNYFRITAYYPKEDFCCVIDCNGMFEKLWQFSSFLVQKGIRVLEVSRLENILDVNLAPVSPDPMHLFLRATADGKPEYVAQAINGTTYKAIKVADKIYVPNKEGSN